jgi:hypothetical protein
MGRMHGRLEAGVTRYCFSTWLSGKPQARTLDRL